MPAKKKLPWNPIIQSAEQQVGRLKLAQVDQAILEVKALREAQSARNTRRRREMTGHRTP